jgi:8-oxo-dGTP pyrophosphatase MutT (NUDIX family)
VTSLTLDRVRELLSHRIPARITDPSAGQAAVALVVTPASDDLQALFIRRAQKAGDPWSGQMGLPGGHRDLEDPDLFHTATREAFEETGVRLGRPELLGQLDDFTPRTPVLPNIVISPYVFGIEAIPTIQASSEVSYHIWVPLSRLRTAEARTKVEIRGSVIDVPAFVLGNDVIWGLTERIVKPFIDLLA